MKKLDYSTAKKLGHFDNGNRFYLSPQFETETSRAIRSPSRRFPYSLLKHLMTGKYFKSLSDEQKTLIEKMAG